MSLLGRFGSWAAWTRSVETWRGPVRDLEMGSVDDQSLQENPLPYTAAILQVFTELFPIHPGSYTEARIL